MTAPFAAPDEENQSMRAIRLSHGGLLPQMGATEAGGQIDLHAAQVMDGFDTIRMQWERRGSDFHNRPWGSMTEAAQGSLSQTRWARRNLFAGFGNTAVYPPLLYLPTAVGWRAGEAADLTIVQTLRLARLLSAIASVLVGWLALRISTPMRWPLFAVLLMPSLIFLQASCSQDAVMLSVAVLAAAVLSRPLARRRELTTCELVGLAGLLGALAMARPPYLALGLLVFLPGLQSVQRARRRWLGPALAFMAVLAAALLWRHAVARFGVDTADQADPAQQLALIQTQPLSAAAAIMRGTLTAAADFFARGLYVLGWNDLLAPWPLRLLEAIALAALFRPGSLMRTRSANALLAFALGGALLALSLAEYIIWTPPGLDTVFGLQPRYWLPVLPFAALWAGCPRTGGLRWLAPSAAVISLLIVASVPVLAARMFYLEPMWQVLRHNVLR